MGTTHGIQAISAEARMHRSKNQGVEMEAAPPTITPHNRKILLLPTSIFLSVPGPYALLV